MYSLNKINNLRERTDRLSIFIEEDSMYQVYDVVISMSIWLKTGINIDIAQDISSVKESNRLSDICYAEQKLTKDIIKEIKNISEPKALAPLKAKFFESFVHSRKYLHSLKSNDILSDDYITSIERDIDHLLYVVLEKDLGIKLFEDNKALIFYSNLVDKHMFDEKELLKLRR